MSFHMGIDQGGSKTVAVIFDAQGRLVSQGTGYGSCFYFDGLEHATEAIRQAVSQALNHSGLKGLEDVDTVTAGIAGVNWPEEEELIRSMLERELANRVKVVNDCLIALRAGTDKPDCAVLCAGTGLNVALRSSDGTERVYSSYIDRLDQGGKGLGERIHRAIFDSETGRLPATRLTERVLAFYNRATVEEVLYDLPRDRLERSAKDMTYLLFETADQGDEVAVKLVRDFGISISEYVTAGLRQYGMRDKDVDIVLTGGLFKTKYPLLLDTIVYEIRSAAPEARIVNAEFEPVIGAMKLSLDSLYPSGIPSEVSDNCGLTAEQFGLTRRIEGR